MTKEEIILEARRLREQGYFDREIVGRTPESIRWDRIELSCGHTAMDAPNLPSKNKRLCAECVDHWINDQMMGNQG